ncbi:lytic transglycosylase [Shewanella sp. NFH-SH190041]|uniref:lytic transglycosylase domain-containing protein n=1 Tax=Shewanella sp. NFH-SH190041 TaxID=2950245 RepID=UPI0021C332D2|nr:lytic transglycosylase domain-containing protein [Shewanella sp. NFH-SH190041]BDM62813.1 lytic transglycosylase [Shewanella sp. NFH-SH190041]
MTQAYYLLRYIRAGLVLVCISLAQLVSIPVIAAVDNSANGQSKGVRVYTYSKPDGTMAFSDTPPSEGHFMVRWYDCYACQVDSDINWQTLALHQHPFRDSIIRAAKLHQLEPALIRAVIHAESNFDVNAVSRSGAMGLMQLMPVTAAEVGVSNAFDGASNILGGSAYLAKMLRRFDGRLDHALAAYNAGPGNVEKYRGIPPFKETRTYIKRVKLLLHRYRAQSS